MNSWGAPWWESKPAATPEAAKAQASIDVTISGALAILQSLVTGVTIMSAEIDALNAQVTAMSNAVNAAVTLIGRLASPVINPADVTAATAALKTATDTLTATTAAHP